MRRSTLVALMCCLMLGSLTLAPNALASDASVRTAIEHSGKEAKESGELQTALRTLREDPKTLAKLHTAIGKFTVLLHKAAAKVSAQKPSTAAGAKGKADWITGIDKVAKGFTDLDKAIGDLKQHEKTAARTEARKAAALVKEGALLGRKGDALLHVKKSS